MKFNLSISVHISRFIKRFILADVLLFAGWGFVDPIFSVFIIRQIAGTTLVTIGIAVALFWFVKSSLQVPIALFLDKTDGERDDFYALIIALILVGVSAFGLALSTRVWHVYLAQLVKAVGFSIYVPSFSSLFSAHLDRGHRSLDYSLDSTFVGFAMGITGLLGGIMATWLGYDSLFIMAGIFALFGAAVLLTVPNLILPPKKSRTEIFKDHDHTPVEY